jgi:two-component system chemotaxis response regulator CheV
MSSLSNILLDKEILLESGTNELEVLVFDVADYTFGINVAKVREVLPAAEIINLPKAHPSIRGVFKLRNQVIPCVSLLDHLGIQPTRQESESTMILTDLNQQQTAFLVDQVERIHRLSWENILAVPGLDALSHTPVTALARCEGRLIVMLDFEMILDDVTDQYFRTDTVENPRGLAREKLHLLLAEDSPTVREAISTTLHNSGYTHLTFFENGAECWGWIEQRLQATGRLEDVGDLLIADVEMPQVDGFHLTKRIKQHPLLKQLPVLLYSSIITPDNRKKGNAVGADAQVAKPELTKVVELADELIFGAQQASRAEGLRAISETAISEASSSAARRSMDHSKPEPSMSIAAELDNTPSQVPPPAATAATEPAAAEPAEPVASERAKVEPAETPASSVAALPDVTTHLWQTFRRELIGRIAHLRELFGRAGEGKPSEELLTDVARTLHTVKSAAMVVPVDQVARSTHQAETLLAAIRENRQPWQPEPFAHYVEWLDSLTSAADDLPAVLAAGQQLEAELSGSIT